MMLFGLVSLPTNLLLSTCRYFATVQMVCTDRKHVFVYITTFGGRYKNGTVL